MEQAKKWVRRVIDTTLADGHTIQSADFNRDGNDEIVAGFRGAPHSVDLWTRSVLDDGGMGAAACAVVDLNGDGRPVPQCGALIRVAAGKQGRCKGRSLTVAARTEP